MHHRVIGRGPVGATVDGLILLHDKVLGQLTLPAGGAVSVEVPPYVVIAAEVFSEFLERNRLQPDGFSGLSDSQIAHLFQRGELPHGLMDDLGRVVDELEGPLIVRSSSALESSLGRSLGDAYVAKLIPNLGDDRQRRLRRLVETVKLVWASTFFADAVSTRLGAGQTVASERMAVVVQRAVGERYGDRFYPSVSAVARSFNHYSAPGDEPGEGVVTLVLGLSKSLGEGRAWSYCPDRPTAPPPFKDTGDLLTNTQTTFWALDLSDQTAPDPNRAGEYLVRFGLVDAEQDGTLALLASTYDVESDRLRAGLTGRGPRALTFAPVLRSRAIPFSSVIRRVLAQARAVTGREVEVEIAATLDPAMGAPVRFGLLQLKTMPGRVVGEALDLDDLAAEGVIAASESCLGNGVRSDIEDVVYLKPEAFDRHQTRIMAAEVEAVNRGLLDEGRAAIFVGFGRWGTTDDRYGVPVRWAQISSARVIVEITMADAPLNLSQGTHFCHNLLSQHVLCLSMEHDGRFGVGFDWLAGHPAEWEGRYVRHVRLDRALEVNVDGSSRRGLIRRPVV